MSTYNMYYFKNAWNDLDTTAEAWFIFIFLPDGNMFDVSLSPNKFGSEMKNVLSSLPTTYLHGPILANIIEKIHLSHSTPTVDIRRQKNCKFFIKHS